MKKILSIIAVATTLLFSNCKNDLLELDPLDRLTDVVVWSDANLVKLYVNSVYNSYSHGFNRYMWSRYSDECYGENAILQGTYTADNISGYSAANQGYLNFWNQGYTYIRKCNLFLENVDKTTFTAAEKTQYTGEVKFVRAFVYANLIWRYGGVPIVTKSYALGDPTTFTRESYDNCVKFIIDELDAVMPSLPDKYAITNANFGRATKHACMALKSRALLYAASELNNPSNDKTKWQKAADAAKAVIDLKAYTMFPDYRNSFQSVNTEMIFARTFNSATGHQATFINTPRFFGGYGGWGGRNCPSVNLVNDFEMNNGMPAFNPDGTVNTASGYDPSNPHDNRDPRFYASILYNGATFQGHTFDYTLGAKGLDANGKPIASGTAGADNYKVSSDNSRTSYNLRKFIDEVVPVSNSTRYTQPWIYFRLGEMYLNFAEASFKLGNEADARTALNVIRKRAGMPDVPTDESGDALWRRIKNERRVELVFEGHRFYDVRRWKIAPTTEIKNIKGRDIYVLPDGKKVYVETDLIVRGAWTDKLYLLPIDRSEIQKNLGALIQNSGWE